MSKKFVIKFQNDVYNLSIDTSQEEDEGQAYSSHEGTLCTFYRESGNKQTIWVKIPVNGGHIVAKIKFARKKTSWSIEMRAVPGKLKCFSSVKYDFLANILLIF
jgi:hypothetical protein